MHPDRTRRRSTTRAIAFIAAALIGLHAHAQGIRYVDATAAPGGDGLSWNTAYHKLFTALDEAAINAAIDQIWVAQGTHSPNRGTGNRNDDFTLVGGLAVYGGFAGGETAPGQRDPDAHPTILSGDFNGNDGSPGTFANFSENARQVITAIDFAEPSTLDGFTVRSGNADFNPNVPPLMGGGGLFIQSATVHVVNCQFIANSAGINQPSVGGFGGAIYNLGGTLVATDCLFGTNRADNGGAIGVRDDNSSPVSASFTNCEFVANKAEHQTGGAVWTGVDPFDTVERDLGFTNCLFQDNLAQYGGAMIENNIKHVRLTDCTFDGNTALVVGGALWHNQSGGPDQEPISITRCTFIDNQSADQGGALFFTATDSIITNCRFLGNQCLNGIGGAIRSGPQFGTSFGVGDLEIYNCIFTGNSAVGMGAIAALRNPIAKIINSTVAGNSANQTTGGIFSDAFNLQITNTILWQNQLGASMNQAAQLVHLTSFGPLSLDHSCVQGLTGSLGGVGNIGLDPLLTDLDGADDSPGTLDDDLHLLSKSPAIDAADQAGLPVDAADLDADGDVIEPLPLDLDGNTRVLGLALDMGAFEFAAPNQPGDANGDGSVNIVDLLLVISAWGACPSPPACPADFNGDDQVNVIDLLTVISNWSAQ